MNDKNEKNIQQTSWQNLIEHRKKAAKVNFFIFIGISLIIFLIISIELYQVRKWDGKVKSYDHVKGILLKHDRVTRGSGRNRRTVSEIKYSFNYKGQKYTGSSIAYGEKDYPHRKIGKSVNIIVNPAQPEDSAAMIYYGSNFAKYDVVYIFGFMAALMLVISVVNLLTMQTSLPQRFIDYCESVPPEKLKEFRSKVLNFSGIPKYTLNGSIKYKYRTYATITNGIGKVAEIIIFIILISNVTGAIITKQPLILIPAAVLFIIALITRPVKIIFNLDERTFTYKKFLSPVPTKNFHSFDDISFLCIIPQQLPKGGLHFTLYIVKNDNKAIYITQVTPAKLTKLCNVTVELAELLGNVPLIVKE